MIRRPPSLPDGYRAAPKYAAWQKSKVFGKQFRLVSFVNRVGHRDFRLEVK
jgi:hypothetical protein